MENLLSALNTMPEFNSLVRSISSGETAAVTGIGQINRSHISAGLRKSLSAPVVILCQDDMAARRLQEELQAFLGETAAVLPSRDLTLYDTAVVSRAWEQKRLRQLYDLYRGQTTLQIMSWEALSQRTMPPQILDHCAFTLTTGQEYDMDSLIRQLTGAGYSRCAMVEGPGQFALRGGILDVFSPAAEMPFRAEFFGDELDTMGYFDPETQRRTENTDQVIVLPVGETQPRLHSDGLSGLCEDLKYLIQRQKRRKNINEPLIKTVGGNFSLYAGSLQITNVNPDSIEVINREKQEPHIYEINDITTLSLTNTQIMNCLVEVRNLTVVGGYNTASSDGFTLYCKDERGNQINIRVDGNTTLHQTKEGTYVQVKQATDSTGEKGYWSEGVLDDDGYGFVNCYEFFLGKTFSVLRGIVGVYDPSDEGQPSKAQVQIMLSLVSDIEFAE